MHYIRRKKIAPLKLIGVGKLFGSVYFKMTCVRYLHIVGMFSQSRRMGCAPVCLGASSYFLFGFKAKDCLEKFIWTILLCFFASQGSLALKEPDFLFCNGDCFKEEFPIQMEFRVGNAWQTACKSSNMSSVCLFCFAVHTGILGIYWYFLSLRRCDQWSLKANFIKWSNWDFLLQIQKVILALGDYMGATCHACIGGTNVRNEMQKLQAEAPHIVVGTPGRVFDMLNRRYLCK